MSFRERLFIDKLYKDAKINLAKIMEKRRHTFWGETPILFRVRKYKVAGEIRSQRVSVVKPQLHKLKLYSQLLRKFVPLQATPQMLRYIEACGGLDDYLLKTPDSKLHSDVASQLKLQLTNLKNDLRAAEGKRQLALQPSQATAEGRQGDVEAAGTQGAGTEQGIGGRADVRKKDTPAIAAMQKAREELAAARRERITRMLQAASAAAAGQQISSSTSTSSSSSIDSQTASSSSGSSSSESKSSQGAAWH